MSIDKLKEKLEEVRKKREAEEKEHADRLKEEKAVEDKWKSEYRDKLKFLEEAGFKVSERRQRLSYYIPYEHELFGNQEPFSPMNEVQVNITTDGKWYTRWMSIEFAQSIDNIEPIISDAAKILDKNDLSL